MIDLIQWRCSVGSFKLKVKCYIGKYTNNAFDIGVLHTVLNIFADYAVLHIVQFIKYICSMLLLCSGDIEVNPGPAFHVACPKCNTQVHIRKKICVCGYRLIKKRGTAVGKRTGRPLGTTRDAGFTSSTGHPTADIDVELNVPIGRPVGTTRDAGFSTSTGHSTTNVDIELNVPTGRPIGTTRDAGFNASTGHPTASVDIELNIPTGRPVGTTRDAGFSTSTGRPEGSIDSIDDLIEEGNPEYSDSTSMFIEENLTLSNEYMKQFDLPKTWSMDNLSVNDSLLARAKKRIGQQVRFDAKPLAIGMCYCCGSILWSRVDNFHTHLVKLNLEDENIPAVAYQHAMITSGKGYLTYRHKSGKLYSCSVCSSLKLPTEYNLKFHVGITEKSNTSEWNMVYPSELTSLKSEVERCQVALCGIFSTTVKDAKKHQWRHIQGEVNALHKLDKHYYGMFGFLMINEQITEKLTEYSGACERIRVALNWFKKNNHLYKDFLARFETMYRYIRQDVVNPEILKGNQDKILESEALGMAFPLDSGYFDQYSYLYGNLDIAGIQSPQPHMIDKVKDSVEWLQECTSVQYGQEYLLEKVFPYLFPYGEGEWHYQCSLGLSQFTKIRLLDPRGQFAKDTNFPFFMFDYMTKVRLRSYNARKVVASSKLETSLTAGTVIAADRPMSDPYASYGTEVPRVIPGSKQYWKGFGYDLVAMTDQLGIPDFFLTLSPNDNWPHIQSTIKKGWGASADPSEFEDLSKKPDNEQSVGFNPLESVLGAEKRFSAMMDIYLTKSLVL